MGISRNPSSAKRPDPDPLLQPIFTFIQAKTWVKSRRVVEAHPELLEEEADALLTQLITAASERNDPNAGRIFSEHRELLRHCRRVNVATAFAEKVAHATVPPQFVDDLHQSQKVNRRCLATSDSAQLDVAVSAWERILNHPAFPATSDRFRLSAINDAANMWRRRYLAHGRLSDLETAIHLLQQGIARLPVDSPDLPLLLNNLGNGLRDRYAHSGQPTDLKKAIRIYQESVTHTPVDSPKLAAFLTNLGNGLRDHYAYTGRLADLEEAIRIFQKSVTHTPVDSPTRPVCLNNLSTGLRDRYAMTGQLVDLEDALRVSQEAVASLPANSPDRPIFLNNLGTCLRERYDAHTGRLIDLEKAIRVFQEAVACTAQDSPFSPGYLTNLASALYARYARTGQITDLEEAIRIFREALTRTPLDAPARAGLLTNLGASLSARYARTGWLAHLEEAIGIFQEAVVRTPADSPDYPSHLNNLGNGLRDRYARTGRLADLEEAIRIHQEAVTRTPSDAPARASRLTNLANSLMARYARTDKLGDLEQAIHIYREAVASTPSDSPARPGNLTNLGTGLRDRYTHTGRLSDLEEAIRVSEEAATHTPADSPARPSLLTNLGTSWSARYAHAGQLADLEQALRVHQEAVARTPADSPHLPSRLNNLGIARRDYYTHTGDLDQQKLAREAYESACQEGREKELETCLTAAHNWGHWAFKRQEWDEANRAYAYGLDAIEQLYRAQLLHTSRQTWLREAQGLYARAAYAQSRINRLEEAVATLEQGRARGLSEALARDRANLEQVKRIAPAAYDKYQEAATRLPQVEAVERRQQLAIEPQQAPDLRELRAQMQQARADLDAAIDLIRQVEGYEDFLKRPEFDDVAAAAVKPLVYMVTTPAGSLALLLSPDADNSAKSCQVLPVWADEFTTTELSALLVKRNGDKVVGGYLPGQLGQTTSLKDALAGGLPRLGESLMAKLALQLHRLGAKAPAACGFLRLRGEVTLIPGGRLSLLPLHAARYQVDGQERTFLSSFTVTYAPSAQALAVSRTLAARREAQPTLFAVGNPATNNQKSLAFARLEVEEVAPRFPEDAQKTFYEKGATRQATVDNLAGATHLHFSCHGTFNVQQPLNSALYLAGNDTLTLRDLLSGDINLSAARLAVLSACQTGITDFQNVPDEAIGFPAGFLQAGVPGVISTLWAVTDISTALLLARFYHHHLTDGMTQAYALRQAQLWLRDVTAKELADHFKKKKDEPGADYMVYSRAWRRFARMKPKEKKPFAHPFYWAAFTFTGV